MAPVGDVNWDGYVDIAIGSPYFDKGAKSNSGRVDLLSGATGDRLWKVKGGKAGQRLGHCVANAGDINGDGINDVVAGAPKYGENRGRVYVRDGWSGTGIARLTGENDGDRFGTASSPDRRDSSRPQFFGIARQY